MISLSRPACPKASTGEKSEALRVVGGATRAHPQARRALTIAGVSRGRELAELAGAVGLAQNLAAALRRQCLAQSMQLATRAMVVESIAWIARLKRRGRPL